MITKHIPTRSPVNDQYLQLYNQPFSRLYIFNPVNTQIKGPAMSKLKALVKSLASKELPSNDPFDENYFNKQDYEEARSKEEASVVEQALNQAAAKAKTYVSNDSNSKGGNWK